MFNRKNFISVNGQVRGSDMINDWKYATTDSEDDISASDYFADVADLLDIGDVIHVYYAQDDYEGTPFLYIKQGIFVVRMVDRIRNHVAALPVGESTKEVFLENKNAGDSTTITIPDGETLSEAYCILSGRVDSEDVTNTVTIKSSGTTLFSAEITSDTADGSVLKMTKDESADASLFQNTEYEVTNDGLADVAHGVLCVVVNTTK